ncbi:MAG: 3-phosphoshikimate 1-carboxyvinyltransferase [Deltaproteobacteria bacterium]|jgi:3-phosphoshikimate 1-carboxyvinyltransferase|nr:3-phosphoshikimate 1-carboxyvinyltransferase [Deltaproteobacteria bacterium]
MNDKPRTSQKVSPARTLLGTFEVPGDKSISHRSIMLGSLADGTTRVNGFLMGDDNLSTVCAFQKMGVTIQQTGATQLEINGCGLDGLSEPEDILDCGNSGTTMRLISGLLSGQRFFSVLTGDQYLRRRPMKRIVEPLTRMGAQIWGRDNGDRAPLAIHGGSMKAISYSTPVASAQIKSAILLAGLFADGETTVKEIHLSRDHTERMLACFGADVRAFDGGVTVKGRPKLVAQELTIPGDISSAAFFMVAGLLIPGSELLIRNVGINPTRSGIVDILKAMNGDLTLIEPRLQSGEPVADVLVRYSQLKGAKIGGELIPRAIDELPVISVAAAFAEGTTTITDARELRVKETDRITAMVSELGKLGVPVEARDDGLIVEGVQQVQGGCVESYGDHRIAMSLAVAGLGASDALEIKDTACTETSFPGFWNLLEQVKA